MTTDYELDLRMITQSVEDCIDLGPRDSEYHFDACIVNAFYNDLRYLLFVRHGWRFNARFTLAEYL